MSCLQKNTFFEYKFNNMEDVNIVFWTFKLDVIMSSSGRVRSRKQTGGHLWYYDWRHVHIPAGLCSCTVKYLSQHARAFFPWWLWPLNSLNLIRSTISLRRPAKTCLPAVRNDSVSVHRDRGWFAFDWKAIFFTIKMIQQLEIRSVERGICPIATSTMNELFL